MKVQDLFNAFLSLIQSDEWNVLTDLQMEEDLTAIAKAAQPWFKFPRCSLEYDANGNFTDNSIGNAEIQVWAAFMKMIWYSRVVDSWENLRPLYTERDFSPAKMLSEYNNRWNEQKKYAEKLEAVYYRSVNGKPFDYTQLVGS